MLSRRVDRIQRQRATTGTHPSLTPGARTSVTDHRLAASNACASVHPARIPEKLKHRLSRTTPTKNPPHTNILCPITHRWWQVPGLRAARPSVRMRVPPAQRTALPDPSGSAGRRTTAGHGLRRPRGPHAHTCRPSQGPRARRRPRQPHRWRR